MSKFYYIILFFLYLLFFNSNIATAGDSTSFDEAWQLKSSNPKKALKIVQQLKESKEFKDQPILQGNVYNLLGLIYKYKLPYDSALFYFHQSYQIRASLKDTKGMASIENNMAGIYRLLNDTANSFSHFNKSISLYRQINDNVNLYNVYQNLANLYDDNLQLDKALPLYISCEKIALQYEDPEKLSDIRLNLANCYFKLHLPQKAIQLYHWCLSDNISKFDTGRWAHTSLNIGGFYIDNHKYDSALIYLNQALKLYIYLGDFEGRSNVYYNLSELYKNEHNFEKALYFKELYNQLYDSIRTKQHDQNINELTIQYETREKEQTIQFEKEKNQQAQTRITIIIIASGIIIILAIFIIYNYRKRIKISEELTRKTIEINNEKIQHLLREHDIKFAAALIEGQEQERKRISTDLHDKLGMLLSTIKMHINTMMIDMEQNHPPSEHQLKTTNQLIDEACQDVRQIAHSLYAGILSQSGLRIALQHLRESVAASGNIQFNLHIYMRDENIAPANELHIYRIIQELISNILKHASAHEINLSLTEQDKNLSLILDDNGRGFQTPNKKGMGLHNIQSRVTTMNGTLNIDSQPGWGTTVIIEIPLSEKDI